MSKSPEIFDPYLGKMWGNLLDQYDNPTYNLKLYLKPETDSSSTGTARQESSETGQVPGESNSNQTTPGASGSAARADAAPTTGTSSTTTTITDKKIVVLAQTGVTATQIDDLELECYRDSSGTSNGVRTLVVSFTIFQPGAATFLDQIQWGRKYLGQDLDKVASTDFYMYLDIDFYGYASDPDYNDERGEIIQILQTTTYKLKTTSIGVKIDNTGSRYTFETAIAPTTGFNDGTFKLSQNIEVRGATLTEAFKSFESQLNNILTNTSTEYSPDEISFNLTPLLKGSGSSTSTTGSQLNGEFIRDENLPRPASNEAVETATEPSFQTPATTAGDARRDADGAQQAGTQQEQRIDQLKISLSEGLSISEAVGQILLNNHEFRTYVTRKTNLQDPGSDSVDVERTFIVWYDIHCEIQNLKWDRNKNQYAKKYIYTPYLVSDARSDISLTTKETAYLTETESISGTSEQRPIAGIATRKLQEIYNAGALSKSYFYIFTGLNDQIINLDIDLDNALTILMPPKGGMIADFAITSGPSETNSVSRQTDMTLGDKLEAAKKTQQAASLVDVFRQIRGLAEGANNLVGLAQGLGKSVEQIRAAVEDSTGAAARQLAASLDGATVNSALRQIGSSDASDPDDVPGTITEISKTNLSGNYSPEVSGVLYAADLVQPSGNITKEEFDAAGLVELSEQVPASVGPATPHTRGIPTPLSGVAVDGPASMLMSYVYRARKSTHFLLNIKMTLRGDPYWLTQINTDAFDETATPSRNRTLNPVPGTKYYFLLTIGTPSRFDYKVNDEDENTGYWSNGKTSGVFSGLYFPIAWKNRFSNGMFTTEIEATKEISVPLQWIQRVPLGNAATAWDALGITNTVVDDLITATGRTTERPDTATGEDVISNPVLPNATGFANPLGDAQYTVTSGFGSRRAPVAGASRNHEGVDIAGVPAGTPVYAAKGGTVIISGDVRGYGNAVYIDHGDGTQTRYGHMQNDSLPFTPGQTVVAGERIGRVGATGRGTGTHLHYEIRTGRSGEAADSATTPIDPRPYLGTGG